MSEAPQISPLNRLDIAALSVALIISGGVLWHFLPLYWYPADEGIFAHVAERILAGDVFGVDIWEPHGGYLHYINAFIFYVLGPDLFWLRLPLFGLGLVQVLASYILLRHQGALVAGLGGIAMTAIGFIQFINPSPNWYVLGIAFLTVLCLKNPDQRVNLLIAGLLLGIAFMFRHPSAVFLASGVTFYLLLDHRQAESNAHGRNLGMALLAVLVLGLITYNVLAWNVTAFILFGIWPIALCLSLIWQHKNIAGDGEVIRRLLWVACGGTIALLPMLILQLLYGDIPLWLTTAFTQAAQIWNHDIFSAVSYWDAPTRLIDYFKLASPLMQGANILFWGYLFALPMVLGLAACREILKGETRNLQHPAIWIAPFFCYVSYYYQVALYFFCVAGLTLIAWQCIARAGVGMQLRALNIALMVVLIVFGITYASMLFPSNLYVRSDLPKVSLKIDLEDHKSYGDILRLINQKSTAEESILAYPMNPELYFISGRRNPLPYPATVFALGAQEDLTAAQEILKKDAPRLVFFHREDKYTRAYDLELFDWFRQVRGYKTLPAIGKFEVLILPHGLKKEAGSQKNSKVE